jgi:hypothetical protein
MATKDKFSFTASPTFKLEVGIPLPGEKKTYAVGFTAKHKGKKALKEFRETVNVDEGITLENVREMFVGWDLADDFNDKNIEAMLDEYPGAGWAMYGRYMGELQDAKLGNSVR